MVKEDGKVEREEDVISILETELNSRECTEMQSKTDKHSLPSDVGSTDTEFRYTLFLIGGKYKNSHFILAI